MGMTAIVNHGSRMSRNALSTVASASFGVVTSVLLDAIVIALFGISQQTDAYFIAVTLPMLFINILNLQATRIIQPIFIGKRQTNGEQDGWNYVNLVITGGTVILAALSLAGAMSSSFIVRTQSAGAPGNEIWLSTRLSACFFLILPIYFPIVVMRAVLNGLGVFVLPGATKFFENTFKIIFVVLLWRKLGVQALALGMLAGAVCQVASFYLALRAKGYRFKTRFDLAHPDMRQAYGLIGYQLSGQVVGTGVEMVNNTLGSMLGAGNVSALRLATRIIDSFAGLLPASVVSAAMPNVAASVAARDPEGTKKHLQHGIYLLMLITVPLSIWLGLMHRPIISFLYQRAKFSAADTALVADLMLLMVPYMLLGRILGLLELPFFAAQDTRTPLLGSLMTAVVYLGIALGLVRSLGIYALPIGRAFAYTASPLFLAYQLRRHIGKLGLGSLRNSAIRICGASIVMGVLVVLSSRLATSVRLHGFIDAVIALSVPSITGVAGLLLSLFALGVLDPSVLRDVVPYFQAKQTRSGEYRVPGRLARFAANMLLAAAPWIPSGIRARFLQRHWYYQTVEEHQAETSQGLSGNKWAAMQMPHDLSGKSIIDIGCSEGFFCRKCVEQGANLVFGIDSGPGRLLCARFVALRDGLNIDYKLDVFPSRDIRRKFDYVLCLSVLHHFLSEKNLWKVMVTDELGADLAILREQLRGLRSLTSERGKCIIEMPYEYEDPADRSQVDFQRFNVELTRAGFRRAECLGSWDYNPEHRLKKDRMLYLAEA
jgi:putative peptidoglycan lipid II flippase